MSKVTELGTSEAARTFDTHPVTLLYLIAQGRLGARKDENGHWRIDRASLEAWNAKRLARRHGKESRAEREVATSRGSA